MGRIIGIKYEAIDDLDKAAAKEVSNKAVAGYGKSLARAIIRMYEKWLRPGGGLPGRNPIGETGDSSRNFEIKSGTKGGVTNVFIVEGSAGNNRYIRVGIPPGKSVTLGRLKLWGARKGIQFLSSAEYKLKHGGKEIEDGQEWTFGKAIKIDAYDSKTGKGDPFNVKEHGRSEKGKKNVVNSALKAIENALYKEGTDRPGSNWHRYFPTDQDGFDYPRYLTTARGRELSDLTSEATDGVAAALVAFVNSGGKTRVFDYKLGRSASSVAGTRAAGRTERL